MKKTVRYSISCLLIAAFCIGMGILAHLEKESRNTRTCERLEVEFSDSLKFVTEKDIRKYVDSRYGAYIGQRLDSVRLTDIEQMLQSRSAIMDCEAWTTDDGVLHVRVGQRAPVLRFDCGDGGFYVDAEGYIFPLHPSYTADVPVVSGGVPFKLKKNYKGEAPEERDRTWLKHIIELSRYINSSKIWRSRISGIRCSSDENVILLSSSGSEKFYLGYPENIAEKLGKVETYFIKILPLKGENHYKSVNVTYNNQIICSQKDI